ncbi:MAG: hypothetical protein IJ486_04270 [Firmicutes bacterium]|nr:hypothetical protein [Bacillota bacterium]
MKKSRILSAFLALVMLLGMCTTGVSAAWADKVDEDENPIIDYMTQVYNNPDKKLAEMIMVKEENGYQMWFEEFTGEVAVVDTASGRTFFSNPIDVAATASTSVAVKEKLLSQVIINYLDNDVSKEMNSYKEAALRGQITLKNIKGGMRVEYTLGEQQTTRLVPRLIEVSRFQSLVLDYIENDWLREKLESFYTLKDPKAPELTERGIIEMQSKFPITLEMAVYVCDPDIKARELRELEEIIKQWCPLYTYEELDYDHTLTGYEGDDAAPPRFRLALEYKIVDGGFEVRLPANGIEFDEESYQFDTVQILPYFGTGSNTFTGYTMIPDGSGSLIRFEDVKGITYNISGQVYGADYAYHEISGQHSEVMRWPVWGVVTNYGEIAPERITAKAADAAATDTAAAAATTTTTTTTDAADSAIGEPVTYTLGYMALVTEGDSLATLMSEHGGTLHPYNTVYAKFTPRPSDTYNLADSISVSGSATWTVTSERKYTESYRIRYFLLTDPAVAEERGVKDYYDASYQGMATALRDYWTETGTLSRLENVEADIPLFIESFGAIETLERVLSFPVETDTPLTTFEDVKTMYNELTELGIPNIDFRLTGFANGTMDYYTYPAKLKWTEAVGGDEGFTDLVAYANEKGFNVYPEFDFAYMNWSDAFDGVYQKRDAIKTIDDRYTVRRAYDPATQSFDRTFALCISPKSYEMFYEKFGPVYASFNNPSISLSTMGTDLNSDFDEDEPYHREDNKAYTIEFMEKMATDYENIMVEGGNAFTLPYVDVVTNMSLESSQYVKASESIPFMGMVLHGSKVITGTAANMEGDINEMILRSIENGASLYFILSYQNTSRLKENMSTSKYYSVNYEIWKEDLVEYYNTLNEAIRDVQDQYIIDHQFLEGERVPDADEAEADAAAEAAAAEALAEEEALAAEKEAKAERLAERLAKQYGTDSEEDAEEADAEEEEDEEEEDNGGLNELGEVIVEEEAEKETPAKYATTSGSIVYVEYENGVSFILNYNSFDITTEVNGKTYTVEGMSFVRID